MAEPAAVVQRRMSFADYLDLPDELRAEYVDGEAIMGPPPTYEHQQICQRVVTLLNAEVAEPLVVVAAAGWHLSEDRIRIPDVMVLRQAPAGPLVTEAPLVTVEVLSTNRSEDLVRKSTEYLEAGVGQYWIVDPRDRVIDVFENTDHGWHQLAHVTDEHPDATVTVHDTAQVRLQLPNVIG